jgi:2'-5' RNA ligase
VTPGTVRVFAALNFEIANVRRVVDATASLRGSSDAPPLRWVPPTRLHVTLKFFGEVDAAIVPPLRDALASVALQAVAPRLTFRGYSAFPSLDDATVVFAEIDDRGGHASRLASVVDELADSFGLPRDARPYHPHMTLARARSATPVRSWLADAPPLKVAASAHEMTLYRSDPTATGGEYDALGRFPLPARATSKEGA